MKTTEATIQVIQMWGATVDTSYMEEKISDKLSEEYYSDTEIKPLAVYGGVSSSRTTSYGRWELTVKINDEIYTTTTTNEDYNDACNSGDYLTEEEQEEVNRNYQYAFDKVIDDNLDRIISDNREQMIY